MNFAHAALVRQRGGLSGTILDSKIIFSIALKANTSSILISHNHPSSNLKPSHADIKLTNQLKDGGELLEIVVWDHLIIFNDSYYGFADDGMM